ncbi:SDR family NAD(P)-dependent oxidoreductase [Pseudoprimorskyibacter insulae]|uniref:Phthiocerol/phenolphthiocerol synthesis polyketide synthase type I PpsE n=1 Tax=Pseudoprimorskyibacter insulae TaxID=1695997 RepID=A0A2R8ATU0_9RHOB|nr:type I polyketide synthase [Pseudoprimorskyibacter insulae]SPF79482.1 Phthiocerol/phenolphthiocerol synthesis polyketide synthase type I PpsE [Pseudoprimorskyibacter insulae]
MIVDQNSWKECDIAVVGLSARLPGVSSLEAFWTALSEGKSFLRPAANGNLSAPLDGFEQFDPAFFGISTDDAALMDPQHRQMLEVAWQALESAGHMPESFDGSIGIFAGCGPNTYLEKNLASNAALLANNGQTDLRRVGNDTDFLVARLAQFLGATGPTVGVQALDATSLAAVHFACTALQDGACDMALCGGVDIDPALTTAGKGAGAGAVVLRRLADAVQDGDQIWGVIKGSTLSRGIAVTPSDIGYIELQGGTADLPNGIVSSTLGDMFGDLGAAAGVAGLIKSCLALHHGAFPIAETPAWEASGKRSAMVQTVGREGEHARVLLEQAPARPAATPPCWNHHLLTLSGRDEAALHENAQRLADYLRANPQADLADVAQTLISGRRAFDLRLAIVADSADQAIEALAAPTGLTTTMHAPETIFVFPGDLAGGLTVANELNQREPIYADTVKRGLAHLSKLTGTKMKTLPSAQDCPEALRLPLAVLTEVAAARMWMGWGIAPVNMIGHGVGELSAACIAGVMSLETALALALAQASCTADQGMARCRVGMTPGALRDRLPDGIDLSAINSIASCDVIGQADAIAKLAQDLNAEGIEVASNLTATGHSTRWATTKLATAIKGAPLAAAMIPMVSGQTGQLLTPAQATDPAYWATRINAPVQFANALGLVAKDNALLLTVGSGTDLADFAAAHPALRPTQAIAGFGAEGPADAQILGTLGQIWAVGGTFDKGQLWDDTTRNRVNLPTYAFRHAPFLIERQEAEQAAAATELLRIDAPDATAWRPVWRPRTAPVEVDLTRDAADLEPQTWLMFLDEAGVGAACCARLRDMGHTVIEVHVGDLYSRTGDLSYLVAPEHGLETYDNLLRDALSRGLVPSRIGHFWMITESEDSRPGSSFFHRIEEQGFYALFYLAQAMVRQGLPVPVQITSFSNGAVRVHDEALPYPAKAMITGPIGVIPRELPQVTAAHLDIELPEPPKESIWNRTKAGIAYQAQRTTLIDALLEELLSEPHNGIAALRGPRRYEQSLRSVKLPEAPQSDAPQTVLIAGGFGRIGYALAQDFAARGANLVLLSKSAMPERDAWDTVTAPALKRRIEMVRQLENAGATVQVYNADLANPVALQQAADAATRSFGRINGVIHAAGTTRKGPIGQLTAGAAETVFAPKVLGQQTLDTVFPDGSVDWIGLCGSVDVFTAAAGHVDRIAADAYLNA